MQDSWPAKENKTSSDMGQCVGNGWKELWNVLLSADEHVRRDDAREELYLSARIITISKQSKLSMELQCALVG